MTEGIAFPPEQREQDGNTNNGVCTETAGDVPLCQTLIRLLFSMPFDLGERGGRPRVK